MSPSRSAERPAPAAPTDNLAFARWFDASMLADERGAPLVLYSVVPAERLGTVYGGGFQVERDSLPALERTLPVSLRLSNTEPHGKPDEPLQSIPLYARLVHPYQFDSPVTLAA